MGHGEYRHSLGEHLTTTDGDLLVLHEVRLDPAWHGLGAILVSETVALRGALAGEFGELCDAYREAGRSS